MTRRTIAAAALIALPAILAAAQSPMRAGALKVSEPVKVAELDMDKLKGQPSRLAWSADGTQLYVQTMEGNFGQPGQKLRHYTVVVSDGSRKDVPAEPEWAAAYWTTKSGQVSPDGPPLKIELKQEARTEKAASTPMGGALARGGTDDGTGPGAGEVMAAADNQQKVMVNAMVLRGTSIGEFVNSVIVPGLTFGWGPKGTRAMAFAEPKNGRIVVLDEKGDKREVAGTKDAILPAWSEDATQIAWLQKDGKKKYVLHIARVESGSIPSPGGFAPADPPALLWIAGDPCAPASSLHYAASRGPLHSARTLALPGPPKQPEACVAAKAAARVARSLRSLALN